ncbi:hypothetical protein AB0F30_22305 [Streptomyces sp. NPDC029006]|uniref:hypothetical protein n=1 Tax=Streptomyces sp. NPDC029006 TaxID=3155467 RepID=UPI0033F592C7
MPEEDPPRLFTAYLYGLEVTLCYEVDALDSYLPPQGSDARLTVANCSRAG